MKRMNYRYQEMKSINFLGQAILIEQLFSFPIVLSYADTYNCLANLPNMVMSQTVLR